MKKEIFGLLVCLFVVSLVIAFENDSENHLNNSSCTKVGCNCSGECNQANMLNHTCNCSKNNSTENHLIGGDRDSHGCLGPAGYSWNSSENECVREWIKNKTEERYQNRTTDVEHNKTRFLNKTDFIPWQKRNESECLTGCECHGAVMSCETDTGRVITIQAGRSGNTIVITINKINATTGLVIITENNSMGNKTKFKAKLKDGEEREIKFMPDTAVEKIIKKLKLKNCNESNNCTIELKEIGKKLTYELQIERHSKIFALFQKKMHVRAQVDADTGEVTKVKKPWWAFIATEPSE
jgi:hypothetical protein